jgi:hypothetical protein
MSIGEFNSACWQALVESARTPAVEEVKRADGELCPRIDTRAGKGSNPRDADLFVN